MGSSASVENDFKELKTQILKSDVFPMTADRFVVKHLLSINSNAKLFKSQQLRYDALHKIKLTNEDKNKLMDINYEIKKLKYDEGTEYSEDNDGTAKSKSNDEVIKEIEYNKKTDRFSENNIIKQLQSEDEESDELKSDNSLNITENWRGQGMEEKLFPKNNIRKIKKIRKTKYMDQAKDIERILSTRKTRSSRNNLLINGNMATPVIFKKTRYLVQNTCPFDAVAVLIATGYTDIPKYKIFIDNNKNDFLQFCLNLAIYGATRYTYKSRVALLKTIFDFNIGVTEIKIIDSRCNVNFIITRFLKYTPSAIETNECSTCKHSNSYNNPSIIINLKNRFENLEEDLKEYVRGSTTNCLRCNGTICKTRKLNDHLFIETDYYSENTEFCLKELPTQLDIYNDR